MTEPGEAFQFTRPPVAKADTLIRRPPEEVFETFVDPAVTTRFWFTKSSGQLEPGAEVTWTWEMYDFSVKAAVKIVEPNEQLVVDRRLRRDDDQ